MGDNADVRRTFQQEHPCGGRSKQRPYENRTTYARDTTMLPAEPGEGETLTFEEVRYIGRGELHLATGATLRKAATRTVHGARLTDVWRIMQMDEDFRRA